MPQEEEAAGRGESEVQPLIQDHPHVSHQVRYDDDHGDDDGDDYDDRHGDDDGDDDEQGEDEAHQVF